MDIQIKKYDIFLKIDINKSSFNGKEKIYVNNFKNISFLSLDSIDLKILNIEIDHINTQYSVNLKKQILKISIPNGEFIIDIKYQGEISNLLTGMYRAKYKKGVMISTQFEAVGARRVFPCIDNPLYKSVFQLSVEVEKQYECISNTKVKDIKEKKNNKVFIFNQTPLMSTYLLYFGIGKFKIIKDKYKDIDIRIISPINIGNGSEVFSFTKKSMKFLEEYFGIPYVLDKLDLIMVPEFAAGAMENWGAITFREIYLNISKNTSTNVKRTSAEVITHELVHQWFGNLVTMYWWDDLWLNESFATFMAYLAIVKMYPDWHFLDNFFIDEKLQALNDDALKSTHPIQVTVSSPHKIDQIFDAISYSKGASILYMIYNFIGDKVFKTSLSLYLSKFQYSNARGIDLWESINANSDINISFIMEDWVKNPGYPLIVVKAKGQKVRLTQQRFFLLKNTKENSKIRKIPLVIKNGDNIQKVLFDKKSIDIDINIDAPVNINYMNSGLYICFYENSLLSKLIESGKLSGTDIFSLILDRYLLFKSGYISLSDFLSFINLFYKNKEYIVREIILMIFNFLTTLLYNNKSVKKNALDFFYYHSEYLGIEERVGDSIDDNIARGKIISSLSKIDSNFANRVSQKYSEITNVSSDLKRAILISNVVSNVFDFEKLSSMYMQSQSDEEKSIIISSIFASKNKGDIISLYSFMLSQNIKIQDWPSVVIGATSNYLYEDLVWDFTIKNIKDILLMFKGSYVPSRIMQSLIPFLGIKRKEELLKFLKDKVFNIAEIGINNGLEYLEIYKNLVDKYNEDTNKKIYGNMINQKI